MPETPISLSAKLKLRPLRIGLLTHPDDAASVAKFIEYCCCVWGGAFNPIIPVFERTPRIWGGRGQPTPAEVTAGYLRYFEPDIFVESKPGIAEKARLRINPRPTLHSKIISLQGILDDGNHRDWSDLAIGLNVADIYADIYKRERQFNALDPRKSLKVSRRSASIAHKAMFGYFPTFKKVKYIGDSYSHVFAPATLHDTNDLWRATYVEGATTPIRATIYELDIARYWYHTPKIFIFDPSSTHDVIDLWNQRSEGSPLIPVPFSLLGDILPEIREIIGRNHRPLPGNQHGIMLHTTIELSRGLTSQLREDSIESLRTLGIDGYSVKIWREPIWEKPNLQGPRRERLELEADEKWITTQVRDWNGRLSATFDGLSPGFAQKYGGSSARWVNVIQPSEDRNDQVATCLPYSTDGSDWPALTRGLGTSTVSSEGWAITSHFVGIPQTLDLLTHEQTVVGALKHQNITAKPSDPGYIAKQIISHLGGLWATGLIRDRETIEMLNKMAMGYRMRESEDGTAEELFDRRSRGIKEWSDLIERRNSGPFGRSVTLEAFTSRGVIRLGIQTRCPNCTHLNWNSLTATSYDLTCDRCQQSYPFPQAGLQSSNKNWAYRAIGPFAVPDYARGSYATVLSLSVLKNMSLSMDALTYAPGLLVEVEGKAHELDFAALHARERLTKNDEPQWVFGETKSLGRGDLLRSTDVERVWRIASRFPHSCLVFSVMRNEFTANEVKLLKRIQRKCNSGRHSLLLLTGNELFYEFSVAETWKKLGGAHAALADRRELGTLDGFSKATQTLYLK
jgi:hypothetical protein